MWWSRWGRLQVYIRGRAEGRDANLAHGTILHFGCELNGRGGVTVGPSSTLHRGVRIHTTWDLVDLHGKPNPEPCGDVVIGQGCDIGPGVSLPPGTVVPDGTKLERGDSIPNNCTTISHAVAPPQKDALREFQPVFAMGTGRSGTRSLAKAFLPREGWTARHEAFPWINALGHAKHMGEMNTASLQSAMLLRWATHYSNEKKVFESDQRFYNLIPALDGLFPKGKFLHVIRPLAGFVRSAMPLGLYQIPEPHDHRWSHYRPQSLRHEAKDWKALTQVERLIWYWTFVNQTILDDLKLVDGERQMVIWLGQEGFESKIGDFCGVEHLTIPRTNTSSDKGVAKADLSKEDRKRCEEAQSAFVAHNPTLPTQP